jgi:hypothetical protein
MLKAYVGQMGQNMSTNTVKEIMNVAVIDRDIVDQIGKDYDRRRREDMAEPRMGRIVFFNLPEGEQRPAIVVKAGEGTKRRLQVFIDPKTDNEFINTMQTFHFAGLVFVEDAECGDKPGQWSFEER